MRACALISDANRARLNEILSACLIKKKTSIDKVLKLEETTSRIVNDHRDLTWKSRIHTCLITSHNHTVGNISITFRDIPLGAVFRL